MKQRVGHITWATSLTATIACIALAGSLAVAGPAYATDPTPTPTPTPTPIPTPPPTPKPVPKPAPKPATHLPVGRGAFGPLVVQVQSRLLWVGMTVKVTGSYDRATAKATMSFQRKFGLKATGVVNTRTYKRLLTLTKKKGRLPAICRKSARILCIDKSQKVVRYLKKNRVVVILDARFGGYRTPTREGLFRVYSKDADHISSQFHTWMPFAM